MNGAVIPHTPIAVDFWRIRQCPNAQVFFLTHLHGDHISGLTPTWSLPIYCTPITKKLLVHKLQIREDLIHELAPNASHTVWLDEAEREMMTVTVIDAHHCPGAAMFLFQGYFGNILHTGDFRYSDKMFINTPLSNTPSIDVLYLDNTYSSPECEFPTRRQAMEQVFEILDKYPEHDVLVGLRSLGKEDLLVAMAFHVQTWVVVSHEQYELLSILDMPNVFTTDPEAGHIHVIPMRQIVPTLKNWNHQRPTIAIIPTALHFGSSDMYGSVEKAFVVPYSDHSSYSEIQKFVEKVRPRKIIPVVDGNARGPRGEDISERADMSRYKKYMDPRAAAPFKVPRSVEAFMRKTHPVIKRKRPLKRKMSKQQMIVSRKRAKVKRGVEFEDSDDFDDTPNSDAESQSSHATQEDIATTSETVFDSLFNNSDVEWHLIPIEIPKERQRSIWKNIVDPRVYFEKMKAKSNADNTCEIASLIADDKTEGTKTPPYIYDVIASPTSTPEDDTEQQISQTLHQELEKCAETVASEFALKSPYRSPSTLSSTGYDRINMLREGPGSAESVCKDSDVETTYQKVHTFDDAVFAHEEIDFVDVLRSDTTNGNIELKNKSSPCCSMGQNEQTTNYYSESAIYPEALLENSIEGNGKSSDCADNSTTVEPESENAPSKACQNNLKENHRPEKSPAASEIVELLDDDREILNSLILTPGSELLENDMGGQDIPLTSSVHVTSDTSNTSVQGINSTPQSESQEDGEQNNVQCSQTPILDPSPAAHPETQELGNEINVQYTQQDVITDANVCVTNGVIPTTNAEMMEGSLDIVPSNIQTLQVSEYMNLDVNSSQFFMDGTGISANDMGLCVTDGEIVIHESEAGSKIDVCVSSNHPLGEHTVLSQHVPYSIDNSVDVASSLNNSTIPVILNQNDQGTPTDGLQTLPDTTSQSACVNTQSAIQDNIGNIQIELQSNGEQSQNTVFTIDVDTLNSILQNQPVSCDNQQSAGLSHGQGGQTVTFTVDNASNSGVAAGAPPVSLVVDPQINAQGPEAVSQELNRLTSELMDRINEALQGAGNQYDGNPDNMAEALFSQIETLPDTDQGDHSITHEENNIEKLKDHSSRSKRQYRVTLKEKSRSEKSEKYFVWGPTSGRSSWQLRGKKREYDPTRILKEENVGLPGGLALAGTTGSYSRWDEQYKTRVNSGGHKKQRGWPKGKPRGPRKKETLYPVEEVRPKGKQIKLIIKLGKAPKTLLSERKGLLPKQRKSSNCRTLEKQDEERPTPQQSENKSIFELLAEICPSWSGTTNPNISSPGIDAEVNPTSVETSLFTQDTMNTLHTANGDQSTGSRVSYNPSSNMAGDNCEPPSGSYEINLENTDAPTMDQNDPPYGTAETTMMSVNEFPEETDMNIDNDIPQDLDTTVTNCVQQADNHEFQQVHEDIFTPPVCNVQEPASDFMSEETLPDLESPPVSDKGYIDPQEPAQSELLQGSSNDISDENGRTYEGDSVSDLSQERNSQEQEFCTARSEENAARPDVGLVNDSQDGNISDQQSWVTCDDNQDVAVMSDLSTPYDTPCNSPLPTLQDTSYIKRVAPTMYNQQKEDSKNRVSTFVHLSESSSDADSVQQHRRSLAKEGDAAPNSEPNQQNVFPNDKEDKEDSVPGSSDLSSEKYSNEPELESNAEDNQIPTPNHLQDETLVAESSHNEISAATAAEKSPGELTDTSNLSQTDMFDTSSEDVTETQNDCYQICSIEPVKPRNTPTDSEIMSTSDNDARREYISIQQSDIQMNSSISDNDAEINTENLEKGSQTHSDSDTTEVYHQVEQDDLQDEIDTQSDIQNEIDTQGDIQNEIDTQSDIQNEIDTQRDLRDEIVSQDDPQDKIGTQGDFQNERDTQGDIPDEMDNVQSTNTEISQSNHSPSTTNTDVTDLTERSKQSPQGCNVDSDKESECYQICSTVPTAFGQQANTASTPSSTNEDRPDGSKVIGNFDDSAPFSFTKTPYPPLRVQRKTKLKRLSFSKVVSTSIGLPKVSTNGEGDTDDVIIIGEGFQHKDRHHYNSINSGVMNIDRSTPLSCVSTGSNTSQCSSSSRIHSPTPEKMDIFEITPVDSSSTTSGQTDNVQSPDVTQTPGRSEEHKVLGYIIKSRAENSAESELSSVDMCGRSPLSTATTDDASISSTSYVVGYNDRASCSPLLRVSSRKARRKYRAVRRSFVIPRFLGHKRTMQSRLSCEQGKSYLPLSNAIATSNYPESSSENTDSERIADFEELLLVQPQKKKCLAEPESDHSTNIGTSNNKSPKDSVQTGPMTETTLDNDTPDPSESDTDSADRCTKLLKVNSKCVSPRYRVAKKILKNQKATENQKVTKVQKNPVPMRVTVPPKASHPIVDKTKSNTVSHVKGRRVTYKVTRSPRVLLCPIVHNGKVTGNLRCDNGVKHKRKDRINVTLTDGEKFDVMGATPKYTTQYKPDVLVD